MENITTIIIISIVIIMTLIIVIPIIILIVIAGKNNKDENKKKTIQIENKQPNITQSRNYNTIEPFNNNNYNYNPDYSNYTNNKIYIKKEFLISKNEWDFYLIFKKILGDNYILLPQVNLAAIINKYGGKYRSELFRNIDFGIFSLNWQPLLMIEINDITHAKQDRNERDWNVKHICDLANLPILFFVTKDKYNENKIIECFRYYNLTTQINIQEQLSLL